MLHLYQQEITRPIPIKSYNLQLDYKVRDQDIINTFLDPKENSLFNQLLRTKSPKSSTWGSPLKSPTRKDIVEQARLKKHNDLLLRGLTSPTSTSYEEKFFQSPSHQIIHNIGLYFKNSLPPRKLVDNPKVQFGLMRKRVIENKTQQIIKQADKADLNDSVIRNTLDTLQQSRPTTSNKGLRPGKKITMRHPLSQSQKKLQEGISTGVVRHLYEKMKPQPPEDGNVPSPTVSRPMTSDFFTRPMKYTKRKNDLRSHDESDDRLLDPDYDPLTEYLKNRGELSTGSKSRPMSGKSQSFRRMEEFKKVRELLNKKKKQQELYKLTSNRSYKSQELKSK
mgnify:CR=1 FL=1